MYNKRSSEIRIIIRSGEGLCKYVCMEYKEEEKKLSRAENL